VRLRQVQHRPVQLLTAERQPRTRMDPGIDLLSPMNPGIHPASRGVAAPQPRGGRSRMERVCFTARIRRDKLAEYTERHERVWPEMADALPAAGSTNYSLFLTRDGLLIGYLETDDFAPAQQRTAQTE